jgi:hypothetical protein
MPPPGILSHPWVYSAKITNGKITFRVEVTDLKSTKRLVEISGQATQVGGAFAPIYAITEVPGAPNGEKDEEGEEDRYYVDVEAEPTPKHPFRKDQDITVFVRVSQAWVTVLGEGTDKPTELVGEDKTAPEGLTWGKFRADARISKH